MSVPAGSSRSPVEEALDVLAGIEDALGRGERLSYEHKPEWVGLFQASQTALATVRERLERLTEERDQARSIPPAVRLVLEKALRADMTEPPVTRAELRFAIDLLPTPPSFFGSVLGMEQLAEAERRAEAAEAELRRLREERDALIERDFWASQTIREQEAELVRLREMLARVRPDIDPETGYGRVEAI